jgi:adhesin transport system membrane fusion protein
MASDTLTTELVQAGRKAKRAAQDRPPIAARLTLIIVACLIAGFVVWAALTSVDEVTRGEGKVIPFSKTQIVQASEPGTIQEIAVKAGQVVKKGQIIARLDDTTIASTLGEATAHQRALEAKIARLDLEQAGNYNAELVCPPEVRAKAPEICKNEASLLSSDERNYQNEVAVLQERRVQKQKDLDQALAEIRRLEDNIQVSGKQLALVQPMVQKKLMAETELLKVEKELTDQKGQLQQIRESIDGLKAAVKEASLQIDQLGLQIQQKALSDKTQALADLSVVNETIRGASDRVARTDVRSPVDGVVNDLAVNTIGAFVQPGTVIATIVPTAEKLLVQARISPRDVAFIRPGQSATVKITAYDFSIYGGLEGEVTNVSADSLVDEKTGKPYYEVLVKTEHSELKKDGRTYSIIPGMVASVDILTGHKTILHYLLKPINKGLSESLTER